MLRSYLKRVFYVLFVALAINYFCSARSSLAAGAVDNILIGRVLKGGVTFSVRCPYRFVITTDSGEKKDIWIPRGNMSITDVDGKLVIGAPPRAGKRMEIKYYIGDNGQYESISMRYVSEDYVPQPKQPAGEQSAQVPAAAAAQNTQVAQGAVSQSANIFTGRIDFLQATMHRQIAHPYCKIIVISADGQKKLFFVPGTTPVFDASGKDISEGGPKVGALFLEKGQRVRVQYSTITNGNMITNGKLGADTVHILE